jgi:hypothetical protein
MDTYTNEQEVKRPSLFLKPINGSVLTLKSHLVKIKSHYLEDQKKSVLCSPDDCVLCSRGEKINHEFYYWGTMGDGEQVTAGPIQVPASVFFYMNEVEKLKKKDKRNFMWIISKQGDGRNVKYTTIQGDDVEAPDEETTTATTERLQKMMQKYEDTLTQRLREYLMSATPTAPKAKAK